MPGSVWPVSSASSSKHTFSQTTPVIGLILFFSSQARESHRTCARLPCYRHLCWCVDWRHSCSTWLGPSMAKLPIDCGVCFDSWLHRRWFRFLDTLYRGRYVRRSQCWWGCKDEWENGEEEEQEEEHCSVMHIGTFLKRQNHFFPAPVLYVDPHNCNVSQTRTEHMLCIWDDFNDIYKDIYK